MGFNFERNPNEVELGEYKKDVLQDGIETLEIHIRNLGGQVESSTKFDPYKSAISSTNF